MNKIKGSRTRAKVSLILALILCLGLVTFGVTTDAMAEDNVAEAAADTVGVGIPADFVDGAIEKAGTAGLKGGDIVEMLEDLKQAYMAGTGADLNGIVDGYISGNTKDDGDMDDKDDGNVNDHDDGDDGDTDHGDDAAGDDDPGHDDGDDGDKHD